MYNFFFSHEFVERELPNTKQGETYTSKEYWEQLANNYAKLWYRTFYCIRMQVHSSASPKIVNVQEGVVVQKSASAKECNYSASAKEQQCHRREVQKSASAEDC